MSENHMLQEPREKAKELGLECVVPAPNEVLVDLDFPKDSVGYKAAKDHMDYMLHIIQEYYPAQIVKETVSPGGNVHVYIRLGIALSDMERLLLQAVLGSDRKRELLSWLQLRLFPEWHNSVLFEKRA